jgi:NAD(P)-dependent dehydrogenase (short-subunit alcohol dehydrogenase family)
MDLKDRVALVAGGTGTLGIAIARALATAGAIKPTRTPSRPR